MSLKNGLNGTPSSESSEIAALLSSLKENLPDDCTSSSYNREKLRETAQKLSLALETPGETAQRIVYLPLYTTVIRVANELGIFRTLADSDEPVSGQSLAQMVNADHLLLFRLLRYLVAIRAVGEVDVDTYVANNITRNLSSQSIEAGVYIGHSLVGSSAIAVPSFLAENHYQNPKGPTQCPFNNGFHTTDTLFEWLPKNPETLHNFNLWMTAQREGRANWLDFFPFKERIADGFRSNDQGDPNDAVMLVDVGGATGHEVDAILKRYPDLPGRFFLQDLPQTIKQARNVSRMESMAYNFFEPQPIKGARAYYLRNVLHDWPDFKCKLILSQLRDAMKPGYSKIFLNELVLPDRGVSLIGAQRDITMMTLLGAMERSEKQWRDLLDSAGLKVERIWTKSPDAESIVEVGLK